MQRTIHSALILAWLGCFASPLSLARDRSLTIETVGVGVQDPSIANETQRRATAREAALTEAQAKMLSLLQSGSSGSAEEKEKIKAGILEGAYVAKTEWAPDGRCIVTLRRKKPA